MLVSLGTKLISPVEAVQMDYFLSHLRLPPKRPLKKKLNLVRGLTIRNDTMI
jgi:hypothetical protein